MIHARATCCRQTDILGDSAGKKKTSSLLQRQSSLPKGVQIARESEQTREREREVTSERASWCSAGAILCVRVAVYKADSERERANERERRERSLGAVMGRGGLLQSCLLFLKVADFGKVIQ